MFRLVTACACLILVAGQAASGAMGTTRLKDLCEIQGARSNPLKGIGLVVGLAGTGDQNTAAVEAQQRVLDRLSVQVGERNSLVSDNMAVVIVTALFPAFAKEGTRIDVQVASVYDAESLEGGTLLPTLLTGVDDQTYAVAQGPVSVGGFNVSAGGAQVSQNHVTVGRIPMGAHIEREIPSTITDGERITLLLKQPDFITANNIQAGIDLVYGDGSATAFGAGAVNVKIPSSATSLVAFIADLQEIGVEADMPARVVINERTGTIVVGGHVMIKPCQVAHGNLTITVASTPVVSQPNPFAAGETVVGAVTEAEVAVEEVRLSQIGGTSASEVANALNKLKVTPRDLIAIFQALRESGSLQADLEIM